MGRIGVRHPADSARGTVKLIGTLRRFSEGVLVTSQHHLSVSTPH